MDLILYFGETGTTRKAAFLLQQFLKNADVIDGKKKQKIDFTQYDHLIFGINIRVGKLNKSFRKFYKKFKKKGLSIPCSAFLVAGDFNQRSTYMNLARNLLPEDSYIGFFGGEFNLAEAKGITKKVLLSCIRKFQDQDLPLPSLLSSAIEDFAGHVSNFVELTIIR